LKESEESFRLLFENMTEGVALHELVYDEKGLAVDYRILRVNRAFQTLLGISSNRAVGSLASVLYGTGRPPYLAEYAAVCQSKKPIVSEIYFQPLDKYFSISVFSPKLDQFATVFQDVTERRRSADALKEAHQLFSTVANTSTALVWMSGLDKLCTWFNEPWLKFTGRTMEQEIGNGWAEGVHPEDFARCLKTYTEAFDKREPFTMEYRLRRYDGEYRWILDPGLPRYDAVGNFVGYIGSCFDITERKQAEESLRESENKYRLLIDTANESILVSQDGLIKFVNPMALRLFELDSEDDLVNKPFPDFTHPDDRDRVIENYRRRINEQSGFPRYTFRVVTKGGNVKWVEMNAVVIEWQGKSATLDLLTDITDRKLAEERLRKSEELYRSILRSTPDAVFITDLKDNRHIMVSPGAVKMFGYQSEDGLVGHLGADYVSPEDRERLGYNISRMFRGEVIGPIGYKALRADGSTFEMESNCEIIRDVEGQPVQLVSIVRDITEHKQSERRQSLTAEILTILNDTHVVTDTIDRILTLIKRDTGFDAVGVRLRMGDDFPYFVQQGFADDFLRTENTLTVRDNMGGPCRDKDGNLSLECTCGVVLSGKTDPANPLFTKRGSVWTNNSLPILDIPPDQDPRLHPRNRCIHEGYRSIALIPIRTNQEIIGLLQLNDHRNGLLSLGMVEYFEGISASIGVAMMRKQAEEALNLAYSEEKRLRQHLEEEARNRIRFIDMLAHEMKGPLTPMLVSSEMLRDVLGADSGSIQKKLADNILDGTKILINRLEELLDVARYARGAIKLNLEPVDVHQFIEQVVSRYTPSIAQRNQQIVAEIAKDLPVANLDPSRLEQVIINLLSNASKYSPEKSRILLTALKRENDLLISVKDEGIGISRDEQDRVFQPYQRVGKEQQKIQGLGLGLTVVKYIVETHGGKVWLSSEPGKGSTFSFSIPIK
jgi:PAS domain S-box-containing protein